MIVPNRPFLTIAYLAVAVLPWVMLLSVIGACYYAVWTVYS